MNASILIVTYNSAPYLEGCLASVSRQKGPDDEIILVDNASSDGSAGMIRIHWPELPLVCNPENRGFAAAANQAARLARKEMLVFLNPDTVVLPGWLEGLRQALLAGQNVALATSRVLPASQLQAINAPAQVAAGRCSGKPASWGQGFCGQKVHFSGLVFGRADGHTAQERCKRIPVSAVSGASFAIRKAVWDELGGFDEGYWMYYEETDLSWRAWRRGYRCVAALEPAVLHERPPAASGQALDRMARNRYLLLLKNFHPGTLMLLAPGVILAEAVDWGRAWTEGTRAVKAKLRANFWLLAHWPLFAIKRNDTAGDLRILESCTYRLEPSNLPAGRAGRALLEMCNALFCIHYRLACAVLRRLGRWRGWIRRGRT
jgi:GT2 family glycosyltransferase